MAFGLEICVLPKINSEGHICFTYKIHARTTFATGFMIILPAVIYRIIGPCVTIESCPLILPWLGEMLILNKPHSPKSDAIFVVLPAPKINQ